MQRSSVLLRQTASLIVPSRSFSAAATWADKYRQASGFRRYGLKAHDLLTYTPEVKEAIKRMEPKDAEERYRRTRIAIDLSMKRDVLYENAPGEFENEYYLTELLSEVEAESKARKDFRNQP